MTATVPEASALAVLCAMQLMIILDGQRGHRALPRSSRARLLPRGLPG